MPKVVLLNTFILSRYVFTLNMRALRNADGLTSVFEHKKIVSGMVSETPLSVGNPCSVVNPRTRPRCHLI